MRTRVGRTVIMSEWVEWRFAYALPGRRWFGRQKEDVDGDARVVAREGCGTGPSIVDGNARREVADEAARQETRLGRGPEGETRYLLTGDRPGGDVDGWVL